MSLDIENKNQAYVLGRLFAVIQKTQEDSLQFANNKKLNRTIKDSYYRGAATQPAIVFQKLLWMYPIYLKKLKENKESTGIAFNREKLMAEVMGNLEKSKSQNGDTENFIPKRFNVVDQGNFHVGYYHQYQSFFKKKGENKNNESNASK